MSIKNFLNYKILWIMMAIILLFCLTPTNSYADTKKIPLSTAEITLSKSSYPYTGTEIKPSITVKIANKEISSYNVNYKNNIKPGTATITVTGKGLYTGSKSITFNIIKRKIKDTDISLSKDWYYYSGTECKPEVTIKNNNITLKKNKDYSITYKNNINPGTASITITGKGTYYTGSVGKTFPIYKESVDRFSITLDNNYCVPTYTYTGLPIKPIVSVFRGNKKLKQGTDYNVSYKNNIITGNATVTITGKGNYTGTSYRTFNIQAPLLSNADFIFTPDINNHTEPSQWYTLKYKYTGKAIKPLTKIVYNGKTLKEGTDYIISYSNNIKPGESKITVTGKGNFSNRTCICYFYICK